MFYHFSQNNSGGTFVFSKESGITHHVIIEAESADDANARAEDIGLYFDDYMDCPCCGSRWSSTYDDWDAKDFPHIYGVPIVDGKYKSREGIKWMGDNPEAVIHYLDGTMEWVEYVR
jgi:hypothetical protein